MKQAVVVDAVRTPMGRSKGGVFRNVRVEDLGVGLIKALLERNPKLDPAEVEDLIWGCANQTLEQGFNVSRMIGLMSGLPFSTAAQTVNRLCGSSLQSIMSAAQAIAADCGDVFICGGAEHMGHVKMDHGVDPPPKYSLRGARADYLMGVTAEMVARMNFITRREQDEFALRSHQLAHEAQTNGTFSKQMIPIWGHDEDGLPVLVDYDEPVRTDANIDALTALRPVFDPRNGTVTAGNSSGISDGAAAVLVMSEERAKALGIEPKAKIKAMAISGIDPAIMGMGPVEATNKVLKRGNLDIDDIEIVELNEAFAAQSLAVLNTLGLDSRMDEMVNVNGGAIALGHPLGCSGARISANLIHMMEEKDLELGLATLCVGLGQGVATVFERA